MERIKNVFVPATDSDFALLPCPFCGETRIRTVQRIDVADLWNHRI